jgi:hypothetical protein
LIDRRAVALLLNEPEIDKLFGKLKSPALECSLFQYRDRQLARLIDRPRSEFTSWSATAAVGEAMPLDKIRYETKRLDVWLYSEVQ